jgi:tetratricopeptide (TPR) repeat protein
VEALSADEAARRIRATGIRLELTAALDDWAVTRRSAHQETVSGWQRLLAVSRVADPDPWRNRLRDALESSSNKDQATALADSEAAAKLAPLTATLLGYVLNSQGEYTRAAAVLEQAQREHPENFWLNHDLAWSLQALTPPRLEESLRYYQAALALRPQYSLLRLDIADVLVKKRETAAAVAAVREVAQDYPDDYRALSRIGRALQSLNQIPESEAAYRRAAALKPDDAPAHYNLGFVLRLQKSYAESEAEYRRSISLNANYGPAYQGLADCLKARGAEAEVLSTYREALRHPLGEPADFSVRMSYSRTLREKGLWDEAIIVLRETVRRHPRSTAYYDLALAFSNKGLRDEAIPAYREAIRFQPGNAFAHHNLGVELLNKGEVDEAIAEFREAGRLNPNHARFHLDLGIALDAQGRYSDAEAAYRRVIALEPDSAAAHNKLGVTQHHQGQFAESLAEFRHANDLVSPSSGQKEAAEQRVRDAERLVALEGKLPALLSGKVQPANAAEQIDLALMCQEHKKLYAAAARLYAAAFAAEPKFAEALSSHRYNAACAAALAGCGQGEDAASLDDAERARLRRQALDWLTADLAAWAKLAEQPATRPRLQQELAHWQRDLDFNGVRGDALTKLSGAERADWQNLWTRVADLLKRLETLETPDGPARRS